MESDLIFAIAMFSLNLFSVSLVYSRLGAVEQSVTDIKEKLGEMKNVKK